ncbi:MAG: glycosyltransferase family 39 protein [Chloroflexi bacterium]|nr:glycosyltransferase family 39 protein [Chloroflexota bacterium]
MINLVLSATLIEHDLTGWDPLGYRVAGSALLHGQGPAIEESLNAQYGPYFTLAAFAVARPEEPARLYLNYPPGFPALLAIPQWLGLPDAVILPLLSTLSVIFTYALGGLLFDRWSGVLAAAIVAFAPTHLEWGTSFWADLPGTCFMLGSLTLYVAATHRQSRGGQLTLGMAAGLLASWTFFIKYYNVLILGPLFAYALYTQRRQLLKVTANWGFAITAGLGLIGIGAYNQWLYGSPVSTYYSSPTNGFAFPQFSLSYALGPSPADGYSLIAAGETLWSNFSWLLVLSGIGLLVVRREARVLLATQLALFLGLSSVFAWAPRGVDTRYLLPLFAPIGLLAAQGVRAVWAQHTTWRKVMFGVIIVAIAFTLIGALTLTVPKLQGRNAASAQVVATARERVVDSEPNAVFLAYAWNDVVRSAGQRSTLFYRRISGPPPEFEETLTRVVTQLLSDGRPVYYIEDTQPPFRDSLAAIQRHFDVQIWKPAPLAVYQIIARP